MNDSIRTDVDYAIQQLELALWMDSKSIREDCINRAYDALERIHDSLQQTCQECGSTFAPDQSGQAYCCLDCEGAARVRCGDAAPE
jgi:hypothetical protein